MGKKSKKPVDAGQAIRYNKTSSVHAPSSPVSWTENPRVHIACLVFLVLITYANSLDAPFGWDEISYVFNNPIVKDLHYFTNLSEAKGFGLYSGVILRYIGYLTFAINYRINGASVTGYHIVNVAIHIANALLVYLLVLLTYRTPFFRNQGSMGKSQWARVKGHESMADSSPIHSFIAFLSAALFAVHPLQTAAVTFLFQRFVSLATFLYLLSLTAYIQSRLSESKRKSFFYYGIAFISAVLAMKTKEIAFTLPLIVTLYEFCFFSSPSLRVPLSRRFCYLVPILLTLSIVPLTLMSLKGVHQLYQTREAMEFSRWEYLFTEFRVIVTYLRLLLFPLKPYIDYEYPVFRSLFNPQVMLSFIFLIALFGLGIYLVLRTERRGLRTEGKGLKAEDQGLRTEEKTRTEGRGLRTEGKGLRAKSEDQNPVLSAQSSVLASQSLFLSPQSSALSPMLSALSPELRLIGFGILWFFITISVESSIIPLFEVINEYRVYLPSIGLIISIVAAIFLLREKMRVQKVRESILALLLIVTGVLSVATYVRNEAYGDTIRIWEVTAKRYPARANVHLMLGNAYEDQHLINKAIEQNLIAIKLMPDYAVAHYNLGNNFGSIGLFDKAIEQYLIAVKLKPDLAEAHFNLALIYYKMGQKEKARGELIAGLKIKPDEQKARQWLNEISR